MRNTDLIVDNKNASRGDEGRERHLYIAGEANVAVGSGPGIQTMRNEHGVVINLSSEQKGVKLTLGGQGVRIALKK